MLDLDTLFEITRVGGAFVVSPTEKTEFTPFAFVLNVKGLKGGRAVELAPGYTLRRAEKSEVDFIREFIAKDLGDANHGIWETRPPKSGAKPVKLPRNKWRYFVIEFGHDDPRIDLLEAALTLAPVSIDLAFAKIRANLKGVVVSACVFRLPAVFQSVTALHLNDKMISLGKPEGDQIKDLFLLMEAHDHSQLDLSGVIDLLLELKVLPHFSSLQVLGYFAILESLLTHQPRPDDRYDSITRQITQKLALLNRRWTTPLNYDPFKGAKHDSIWKKMYAYRSAIAHGGKPDFKTDLALLQDATIANFLIRDAVKKSIRQALVEPQLISDLRHC